ncbi:MAG: LysR family transcriptional regulator [Treponema sp.]|nr:LysR family transcriptional regulator [Treponema sp.]
MFEVFQVKQFLKLIECGTMLKASDELNITEPGLSKFIKRFESELGVSLFDRYKNRIELNETGRFAEKLFSSWVKESDEIVKKIKAFDESRKIIKIASISPLPLTRNIINFIEALYPNITSSYEILNNEPALISGLKNDKYRLIVTSKAVFEEGIITFKYGEERLYVTVPKENAFNFEKSGIYFKELNGQTVLSLPQKGFWYDLPYKMLPDSHIIDHNELYDFTEIMEDSSFATFITSFLMERYTYPEDRLAIPVLDEEALLTYWCSFRLSDELFFKKLLHALAGK